EPYCFCICYYSDNIATVSIRYLNLEIQYIHGYQGWYYENILGGDRRIYILERLYNKKIRFFIKRTI
ncbi:hypothetical protein BCV72DRAFT_224347, partial [Rhizopus microsporus var. microsporus]